MTTRPMDPVKLRRLIIVAVIVTVVAVGAALIFRSGPEPYGGFLCTATHLDKNGRPLSC